MKKVFLILITLFFTGSSFCQQSGPQQTLTLVNEGKNDEAIAQIKADLLQKETADQHILIAIAYIEKEEYLSISSCNSCRCFSSFLFVDKNSS